MEALQGKTAVVVGASTGIGRATAIAFAREGMNVVLASSNSERLEAAADTVRKTGANAIAVRCDVRDHAAVDALAARAFAEFGEVHLLCNHAAVTTLGPLIDHKPEDWRWVYDVVVMGVVNAIHAFLPRFVAQGTGHVVNVGSVMALVPDAILEYGPYTSAKAAVNSLTLMLRQEMASKGIGVSLLIPGGVKSELTRRAGDHGPVNPADYQLRLSATAAEAAGSALEAKQLGEQRGYSTAEAMAAATVAGVKSNDPMIFVPTWFKPVAEEYFSRTLSSFDRWENQALEV